MSERSLKDNGQLHVCSRCGCSQLTAAILLCNKTNVPGGLMLCSPCHNVLHANSCCSTANFLPARHLCVICHQPQATLACPLCSETEFSATLCDFCESHVHADHKVVHRDHILHLLE